MTDKRRPKSRKELGPLPNEFATLPVSKVKIEDMSREALTSLIAMVDHARDRGDALVTRPFLSPADKWPWWDDDQMEVLETIGELRAIADMMVTLFREERKRRPLLTH